MTKTFVKNSAGQSNERFNACDDLSFSVAPGEVVAILGETGSGKSTTLQLLLGLSKPTAGSVRVLSKDPHEHFARLKGRLAIVFQEDRLLPWRTARENVTFGLETGRIGSRQERNDVADEWLERLGLGAFASAYPSQLSGGMRQRVAIARAFAIEPELLIGDETFSALDEITAADVRDDLLRLIDETRRTTVFVTHSVGEAIDIAARVLVFGRPAQVIGEVDVAGALAAGTSRTAVADRVRSLLREARDRSSLADVS
ncbi:MAG: ABC transporter ATP-binding protein [Nocardioidaceae bacterium]